MTRSGACGQSVMSLGSMPVLPRVEDAAAVDEGLAEALAVAVDRVGGAEHGEAADQTPQLNSMATPPLLRDHKSSPRAS